MTFPKGFIWGAATSSFQIEGASDVSERGESVWDAFCRVPGAVRDGSNGDVACDHVKRFREDVAIMRDMGLRGYRLSISWPRVMPEGVGPVNEAGLSFYDRLVDELLAADIRPYVTLYHWDLPTALHRRGGWLNESIPCWFDEYTRAVVDRLSDRVAHWMTLNEPQVFIGFGYATGEHAPGLQLPFREQIRIGHHTLLAHAMAVRSIRERAKATPCVGWAPVGVVDYPVTESEEDIGAARMSTLAAHRPDVWSNTWFNDPVFFGRYPEDGLNAYGELLPRGWERDMELIRQPLDYLGLNIYRGGAVRADADGAPERVPYPVGGARTAIGWEVTPETLYWGPRFFFERYDVPICITENGIACHDWVSEDESVHDPHRVEFTSRYLAQLRRAIEDGVDVRAYFHWAFMDNFEWAYGYSQRFGMVYVDYATQKRTPKDSARWYAEVIRSDGASLGLEIAAPPEVSVRQRTATEQTGN
jgi:beta-glucosidase